MRKRLREREPLLVRRTQDGKEGAAHRVGVALCVADRIESRAKPVLVMREDLVDAARKIVEGISVRREHPSDGQRANGAERIEKIAEWIVPRVRIYPTFDVIRGSTWSPEKSTRSAPSTSTA